MSKSRPFSQYCRLISMIQFILFLVIMSFLYSESCFASIMIHKLELWRTAMSANYQIVKNKSELNAAFALQLSTRTNFFNQRSKIGSAEVASTQINSCKDCGLGDYKFRLEQLEEPLVLQISHRYSDLFTFEIGQALCLRADYLACGFNNTHRRSYDFAHEDDSPFQDFTRAVAEQFPNTVFVQIHGFEQRKRQARSLASVHMILSGGQKKFAPAIDEALKKLDLHENPNIKIYGRDADELGATRNKQGRLIRSMGIGHFLHVELSYEYRQKLMYDTREINRLRKIIRSIGRELRQAKPASSTSQSQTAKSKRSEQTKKKK